MSDLRTTDTNAADDSSGQLFGLAGNLYLWPVATGVGGILLFAGCAFLFRTGFLIAGFVGGTPVAVTLVWILFLKHGKPRGYDRDFLENKITHGHFTRAVEGQSLGKTHDRAPDGVFVDDMILFGSPEESGVVSRGFWLEPPDSRGASNEYKNTCQDRLRSLLALAGPGRRMQFQWFPDGEFRVDLAPYHEATQSVESPLIRELRSERITRYWPRMLAGNLRRERLAVFLSIEITAYTGNVRTREGIRTQYTALLNELSSQFEEFGHTLQTIFGADTPVRPMTDREHFRLLYRFLNPSAARRLAEGTEPAFDPTGTLQENCWHSEGVGQSSGGFLLDGAYHAVLTLDRWPRQTRPGMVTYLTGLPFLDYSITVNVTPSGARSEITKEEKAADRLRGEYGDRPRPSLLVALRKKERKVEALSGGFSRPFHVTYVIRVWAQTPETLRERVSALQAAANAMDGAQVFECTLPTTAKKLFFGTWPGWTHSSYRHRDLYAEDAYLADVLPFSSTFGGSLPHAEALYDGSHGNLVGVSTQAHGSPQHALVCGMSGAGKSEFLADLFFQTAPFFDYTVIVDIGFSHKRFTQSLGETPIVVHPDARLTLNYLDTQGLPLTQLQLATSVALLARMAGVPDHPETLALRQAQLSQYLEQLYLDTFAHWARRYPEAADDVRRMACAVHRWREKSGSGATPLDAFLDLRDLLQRNDDEALAFVAAIPESAITAFSQDPVSARFVAHTACAQYAHSEFPTHSALVDLLSFARFPEHDRDEIGKLATLLRAWTCIGPYGALFDGVSTVSLQRRIAHFELSLIPEQATELKAAVGLAISGLARQHIISLPREQRKRILFEEVSQFLDIPGGEQIVAESYAQLRKYNCWAVSVVQQYARFRASRIRSAVIGNAKQFFLLRQSDRNDMADLAKDIGLPETAVEAIQRYPMPEQQSPSDRFSSVCYFTPTTQPPRCGTLRHVQAAPR